MNYFGESPRELKGFLFSGVHCGIKSNRAKKDFALMVSEEPGTAVAGVFTRNAFAAGPVLLGQESLKLGRGRGTVIAVNSGIANAGIGERSLRDAKTMRDFAAKLLEAPKDYVFVSSTGKIGLPLPMEKIEAGIEAAFEKLSPSGFADAAEAITTTDKSIKVGYITGKIAGKPYTIASMAKGAGMISPNMATMLSYTFTDLAVSPAFLKKALKLAVDQSFNCTSVDGDMSTNDTALLLANGRAGNSPIKGGAEGERFIKELTDLLTYLTKEMVLDGEGATKCLEIRVTKAKSVAQAEKIARGIGNSSLVKCAFFGSDPNWGRILSAAGATDWGLNPDKVSLSIAGTTLFKNGVPKVFSEKDLAQKLQVLREVPIEFSLNAGSAQARFFASDLTVDYVRFNSAYRT